MGVRQKEVPMPDSGMEFHVQVKLPLTDDQKASIDAAIQQAVTTELARLDLHPSKITTLGSSSARNDGPKPMSNWPWPWLGLILE